MRYVEKGNLYMSIPRIYDSYTHTQNRESVETHLYQNIIQKYHIPTYSIPPNVPIYFQDDPYKYAKKIYPKIENVPDYLIMCYDSYSLSDRLSPLLYIKKKLQLENTLAMSLCDTGALSAIISVEWVAVSQHSAYVVCLEQTSSMLEWDPLKWYPRADAIAMFTLSWEPSDLEVIAYDYTHLSIDANAEELAHTSIKMTNDMFDQFDLTTSNCVVIAHSLSKRYTQVLKTHLSSCEIKDDNRNLASADVFYTLHYTLTNLQHQVPPFILLLIADPKGMTGSLLLRVHKKYS